MWTKPRERHHKHYKFQPLARAIQHKYNYTLTVKIALRKDKLIFSSHKIKIKCPEIDEVSDHLG